MYVCDTLVVFSGVWRLTELSGDEEVKRAAIEDLIQVPFRHPPCAAHDHSQYQANTSPR